MRGGGGGGGRLIYDWREGQKLATKDTWSGKRRAFYITSSFKTNFGGRRINGPGSTINASS